MSSINNVWDSTKRKSFILTVVPHVRTKIREKGKREIKHDNR